MTAPKAKLTADNIVLLSGEPERPKWLPRRLHKRWDEKVSAYRQRGLSLRGFEDQLALYIATLDDVEKEMKAGRPVQASMLAQVRQMGREFFDTPQSTDQAKFGSGGHKPKDGNPFGQRGVRPKAVE